MAKTRRDEDQQYTCRACGKYANDAADLEAITWRGEDGDRREARVCRYAPSACRWRADKLGGMPTGLREAQDALYPRR